MTFYGSKLVPGDKPPQGTPVTIEGLETPAVVHKDGMTLTGTDGKMVSRCCFKLNLLIQILTQSIFAQFNEISMWEKRILTTAIAIQNEIWG